ncbi:Outer membrane TonB-dependent transporter, utilization system for glycans and polysaccharides (PUL), SusC family [Bacteroides ovatus]|jgi:tonB-linked outer membrane protein, susC/ragA family|uniref:SusC/RagA family TonB-linked outer membrane protein n=1 Tax=Bacteroides TaxID=816 RepID=UPI000E8890BB|nr:MULTISPECIES: SusC/RagA family TonB-linked outer membrane protein [Bacteroides]MCS3176714.1 SusC/RagA family TonB-linked outer membrane protein [Candidatus Bacteroides intestinigallinarum]RGN66502.1 SusC/RagA family TonB-linked outer membrane protein [Bacteroides sp. OM05-10AA]RGQ68807.1 SusC/RagA family TonB-linked outer membrane protein [Bacteroides sp. AF27-33]CAG9902175.1 Outer membrane TonB-dependent transporter, utilization system for glycans and polysaccharides (PUL), SusC family [Bac
MYNMAIKKNDRFYFMLLAVCMLLGMLSPNVSAQKTSKYADITGKVVDQYGNPVSDVTVTMKNSDFKVMTGVDGVFKFQLKKGDVLRLSHPGFTYKEIKVNKLKNTERIFKVTLDEHFIKDKEVINGPYEEKDKNSFLGSASTVYTDKLSSMMGTTILPALEGRLSGLNITQYRGARVHQTSANSTSDIIGNVPVFGEGFYSDNTEFNVGSRGIAPVVVIDGIQRELYSIDPDAIESVSIQKDALSSMFLGMRSSRGALVITTKEPIKQGFQLSFTGRFGVQSALKTPNPLSAYQYAYLLNEALQNDGKDPFYTYDDFDKFRTQSSPYTHPNVNWFDEILNKTSTTQSYNLNVTGGNKFAQYFVSIGYMDENGLFSNPTESDAHDTNLSYSRYMISSKVNINITDDFTAKVTLLGRVEDGNQPGVNYSNLLNTIYTTPNNAYPIKNPNGTWGGNVTFDNNLMSQAINSGYIMDTARDMVGGINLKYNFDKLVKGLSARLVGNVSIQNRSYTERSKRAPVYSYGFDKEGKETYTQYGSSNSQINKFYSVTSYQQMYGQFAVDYNRRFGVHGVKATLMGDTRHTLVNYDLPQLPSNIITDVAYDYAEKYFVQAALSESYYNRYAPGKRWGTFYAFGLGWDISKENFMENVDWLNKLKIRGVFGKTGNGIDNSGYYMYQQTFSHIGTAGYPLGTEMSAMGNVTMENTPLANPFLTWEKAYKVNVGVDLAMFNNRLKFTADYYNDKYFDLLQNRGKSIELIGQSYPMENIGKVRRFGGDLSITYQDRVNDFNYYVSANWSCEQSKLLYMDEQEVPEEYLRQTGRPAGAIYGLVADGFFTTREEINTSPVIEGFENIQPGDIKYKDLNGDKVINEFDRTVIGGDKPYSYFGIDLGFEWRGLEFSMFWQGAYNRDLYLQDWTLLEGFQTNGRYYGQAYENMLGRWTPESAETATFPRLTAGGNEYNRGNGWNSSFWLRSGNFIRLKNISLGYSLPDSFCNNYLGGLRLKIFVNGQNLFTKSACDLVDPEVGFTSYPLQRCISTGINIRF